MIEMEEEKKKNMPPTDSELEDRQKAEILKQKAEILANNNRDEVKEMN